MKTDCSLHQIHTLLGYFFVYFTRRVQAQIAQLITLIGWENIFPTMAVLQNKSIHIPFCQVLFLKM